ncbi:MAG: LysR family transcriptional regulator [Gammaproteobacteria bacterium]|nr:MAG: LysR family transcriptional regulator [Gammaproteobacteria bacterium]
MKPNTTLDQWRVLQTIIDEGGFAQAARALHRSQSSVSYAIRRLQEILGVDLLEIHGRRAELTSEGRVLLERARLLLQQAVAIEASAGQMQQGWEANIRLAVENVFPTWILLETLKRFEPLSRGTRIHLREEVLSGVGDALASNLVDLAVSPIVPPGYLSENLTEVEFLAVAHADHALHQARGSFLGMDALKQAVHIVIRDSGLRARDVGWLQSEQKWTVSSFATAVDMVARGLGFAWLPAGHIKPLLDSGALKILNLEKGARFRVPVYLIYAQDSELGPATSLFVEILKNIMNEKEDE